MKLITNSSDCDIIDFNVDGKKYSIMAGTSERMEDNAVDYLCRIYGFLKDEGLCIDGRDEPTAAKRKAVEKANEAIESLKEEEDEEEEEVQVKPKKVLESLSTIHGLGGKSIEKLLAADIKTKEQFNKLKHNELVDIVGALVASKFKSS